MDATSLAAEPVALVGRLAALRQRLGERMIAGSPWPVRLRGGVEQVLADADALAIEPALRRLMTLSEIWECSAGSSDDCSSGDEAQFVAVALDRLIEGISAGTAPDAVRWVLTESERRWAEYLRLLDQETAAEEPQEPQWASLPGDEPPAIGAEELLRLLAGKEEREPPSSAQPEAQGPSDDSRHAVSQHPVRPVRNDAEVLASEKPADTVGLPPDLPNDLREAFLAEAAEIADRLQSLLFQLPCGDVGGVAREIGRALHTLKGAAGSIGMAELARVVHTLEEQIERDTASGAECLATYLESGLNTLDVWLEALRQARPAACSDPSEASPRSAPGAERAQAVPENGAATASAPGVGFESESTLRVATERVDALSDLAQEIASRGGFWNQQAQTLRNLVTELQACSGVLAASIERLEDAIESNPRRAPDRSRLTALARRLKEQFADLGMLAIQLRSAAEIQREEWEFARRNWSQLWAALQAIRVVPVRGLLQRLARVARDAAHVEGRQIDVELIGADQPLDRAIQERAFQPLLHIVRNAVGHGIEPPAERVALGKNPTGHVRIAAYPQGHQLVFEVEDDGRGLDNRAIEAKARRLGLLGPDEQPTCAQLQALVFRSGFSTREQANTIAGRGVGLDAARNEIHRMRGSLELESRYHEGTRFSVHVPTRLALAQMLIVKVDGQLFGIPLDLIESIASPATGALEAGVATAHRHASRPVCVRSALGLGRSPAPPCPMLVIAHGLNESTALGVESIEGIQELVVKPLPALVRDHPALSGTCFTTLGETVLVLNPAGLGRLARQPWPAANPDGLNSMAERTALVVDDSISARTASARVLRHLGFRVDEAADGDQARTRLRQGSYHLLVTDLEMPRRDGFELLGELHQAAEAGAMKIIALSSRADPETETRVVRLGADVFLAKPAQADRITRAVQSLFSPGKEL